ncbi:MAG: hypothetical protein Q4B69_00505 [Slackia sp.]|nr:hypothetical protein [Slackia sp.]
MMKKAAVVLCACLAMAGLSACVGGGAADQANTDGGNSGMAAESKKQEEKPLDDGSPEGIIASIQADFESTISDLNTKLEDVHNTIGGTYEGYLENQKVLEDWYAYAEEQVVSLGDRTRENGVEYFKSVVNTIDHEDGRALDRALDDYYDAVYEDAYDGLYDAIYEDAFDSAYDTYYDGIILDAQDSLGYSEVSDVRSDAYKAYDRARSGVYKGIDRARSDIYQDRSDVMSGFYNKEFDIDKILGLNGSSSQASSSSEVAEAAAESKEPAAGADLSSASAVTPEFKNAMDSYEAFFDEYVSFMEKYKGSDDPAALMADYSTYMQKYTETMSALGEIDESTLSEADALYYAEVSGRIATKTAGLF